MELNQEMSMTKTLLDAVNLQAVKGEIKLEDYNGFLESLNDNISPDFRVVPLAVVPLSVQRYLKKRKLPK